MFKVHEGCFGRAPSARSVTRYRKEAKRGSWVSVQDTIERTLDSLDRNYRLRQSGRPIPENEATKLNLFGK